MAQSEGIDAILGVPERTWAVKDGVLIISPERIELDGQTILSKPTSPEQIDRYSRVVVLEAERTGDLSTKRAFWKAQNGLHAMGALFPAQRQHISDFETLQGVLFPTTMRYELGTEVTIQWVRALEGKEVYCLTSALDERQQRERLNRILNPNHGPYTLAIFGLGDIGSYVAAVLRGESISESNIDKLVISSGNNATVDALALELHSINREGVKQPKVIPVKIEDLQKIFFGTYFDPVTGEEVSYTTDFVLFLASYPPPDPDTLNNGTDVRSIQFEENSKIVREFAKYAEGLRWNGVILMGSDPVEQMTYLALEELRSRGLSNQQLAGYGAMINRSRAFRMAEHLRVKEQFIEEGCVFGPHGKAVIATPSFSDYDPQLAEQLSVSTGHYNYLIRQQGRKPYLGPAQVIPWGIEHLLNEKLTYASPFLPGADGDHGAFFGTRLSYEPSTGVWVPRVDQPCNPKLMEALYRCFGWVEMTSGNPEHLRVDPFKLEVSKTPRHFAFHEDLYAKWLEKIRPMPPPLLLI